MPKSFETALIEASNSQSDPEQLQALSEWKRSNECARLRQAIAANPSCDQALMLELAAEYPNEVIANPRFQLLLISAERWWEDVEPISMLRLLAALGATAPRRTRLDFWDRLGDLLAGTDPLEMNMEWHMSFSEEITVEWQAGSDEEDAEDEERDADADEPKEQEFSIEFSCVVEENLYFLNPPAAIEDPLGCIEDLLGASSSDELLGVLEAHGWQEESDSTPGGQGYWGIESVAPQLDDWEFESQLLGDGSGSIQITDPTGELHEIQIDAPGDYGDEYLNPTLNEHPDLMGCIFETDAVSSAELIKLLQQVIAIEKDSLGNEGNPVQSQ